MATTIPPERLAIDPFEAARERHRARIQGTIFTSDHGADRWDERTPSDSVAPETAWREAVPIHYPSARDKMLARYHPRTDVVLLAKDGVLVTCIALGDRAADEQHYVRTQVTN